MLDKRTYQKNVPDQLKTEIDSIPSFQKLRRTPVRTLDENHLIRSIKSKLALKSEFIGDETKKLLEFSIRSSGVMNTPISKDKRAAIAPTLASNFSLSKLAAPKKIAKFSKTVEKERLTAGSEISSFRELRVKRKTTESETPSKFDAARLKKLNQRLQAIDKENEEIKKRIEQIQKVTKSSLAMSQNRELKFRTKIKDLRDSNFELKKTLESLKKVEKESHILLNSLETGTLYSLLKKCVNIGKASNKAPNKNGTHIRSHNQPPFELSFGQGFE